MSWLHIAKIPGPDGTGAWLVVPGCEIDDNHFRVFGAALNGTPAPAPVRWLPIFGGWLVPSASENVLWSVIAATWGDGIVCRQCLYSEQPCDAWMRDVSTRFESAHQRQMQDFAYRQDQGRRLAYLPNPTGYQTQMPRQDWSQRRPSYREPHRDPPQWSPPPRQPPPPPPRSRHPRRPPAESGGAAAAARVLGISWPATRAEVVKAFRAAAVRVHPDLGGTDEAMRAVIEARDTLLNGR